MKAVKLVNNAVALVLVIGATLWVGTINAGVVSYGVNLDTSTLSGRSGGPFSLAFQFSDGSGLGDGNNTVTLSGFDLGGGTTINAPSTLGGASGGIGSTIVLKDSLFFNTFVQQFSPGSYVKFHVDITNTVDAGSPPDEFDFAILDATGQPISTQTRQPLYNPLTSIIINSATPTVQTFAVQTATKVGVFRNRNSYLLDSTGAEQYIAGTSRFINTFSQGLPNGGALAGDIGVSGDWTGDTKYKIGVYRPSTGEWFLDTNNNGIFDAGDVKYNFGGIPTDLPVVGDWAGVGKSCVGIFRAGGFWLLDLNCNGTFDNTPTDAFFPFGGLAGDVPVVGAWTGTNTAVGVVRAYAPGGVQKGPPFFWVLDSGTASAGNLPANHQPASAPIGLFPFGGVPCTTASVPGCSVANPLLTSDIYVAGDWIGTGVYHAGVYRNGSWILDLTGAHTYDTFFQFGGVSTDTPVVGKW